MLILILLAVLIGMIIISPLFDVMLFAMTPYDFRQKYWWRYLPFGGLAVYIKYRLSE
jgi:Na+-transporting NADH:ubiquinone oxidoreductase subunit NqrB